MKIEPRDLWVQALSGGLQAAFIDAMTGYKATNMVNPQHFLVPEWMYVVAQVCLEKPMFAGIPLVPYKTEMVIPTGQYLPEGDPIPGLTDEEFGRMMGRFVGNMVDHAPSP